MFIIESYSTAVIFCIVTMLCWGSSSNTQKLAVNWRYELFCWDYVIGIFLTSLLFAFTLGTFGDSGRSFLPDLKQADTENFVSALLGGVIFNAANILFMAAVSIAGMSVAFSVGSGLALVLGVVVNFLDSPVDDATLLFSGVGLIVIGILLNANAYKKMSAVRKSVSMKGLVLSVGSGLLMGLFYKFVASSMSLAFNSPVVGKLSPYTAIFIFSTGIFLSNTFFNTLIMAKPFVGKAVTYTDYFTGSLKNHLLGILGGAMWCVGMSFSLLSSEKAGTAISYGLASGAIIVASFWGIFFWKEFKNAPKGTSILLNIMLLCFLSGLLLIILSR